MRTQALLTLLISLPLLTTAQKPSTPAKAPMPPKTLSAEAVHASAIVIDTHADTPQRFLDENYDLADALKGGDWNIETARKGNLGAEFFSIWVEPDQYKGHEARRTLELIDAVKQQIAKHPKELMLATSPAEIEQARQQHKIAALMGIEGGQSIENSIGLLRQYYALGVRYMTLTWANSVGWADSSGDVNDKTVQHTTEGLTEFGKDVVYEMNRLGMMVDISHVSDRTFYRTLIISRAPIIASHSSSRAICDAPRNMTDDMIRAVAGSGGPNSRGGVVQVNFYSGFLSQDYRNAYLKMQPEVAKQIQAYKDKAKADGHEADPVEIEKIRTAAANTIPRPPLSILIDHIDHIVKVAGIDHVGLGSDFDGVSGQMPEGINSPADLPKITAALMARGYSAADVKKILGGNLMRVFHEVEATAKELQSVETRPRIGDKQQFAK